MKKRLLAAVLATMMVLTGCGSVGATTENAKTDSVNNGNTKEETVTINYYGRPDDNNVESTIVAAFEEAHPNIKVNYVELPDSSNDRLKTINTVLQAGDSSIDVLLRKCYN